MLTVTLLVLGVMACAGGAMFLLVRSKIRSGNRAIRATMTTGRQAR
jgi:hypothetical protein